MSEQNPVDMLLSALRETSDGLRLTPESADKLRARAAREGARRAALEAFAASSWRLSLAGALLAAIAVGYASHTGSLVETASQQLSVLPW